MIRSSTVARSLVVLVAAASAAMGQGTQTPAKVARKRAGGPSDGTYMGRPIAQTMSYLGADWLERPERVEEEQPEAMVDAFKIAPGETVADFGAGSGYITRRMARRVGPKGLVYAVDIQPEMIRILKDNLREAGIKNVKTVLAAGSDPKLPAGALDLVVMVDVYHECADPEGVLRGVRSALKPGGRLVLVEYRGEDPDVPIKPEHKMTVEQVRRELEPVGFRLKDRQEFLPWQHILTFETPREDAGEGPGPGKTAPPR